MDYDILSMQRYSIHTSVPKYHPSHSSKLELLVLPTVFFTEIGLVDITRDISLDQLLLVTMLHRACRLSQCKAHNVHTLINTRLSQFAASSPTRWRSI